MATNLKLRNFKSAEDLCVPLAPLTVLTGLNGSGKSSVLQAIALLKQSVGAGDDLPSLRLRGDLLNLGLSEDVHFEGAESDEIEICLSADDGVLALKVAAEPGVDTLKPSGFQFTSEKLRESFQRFQYIQADRIAPASQYQVAGTPTQRSGWLGTRGEFAVDFLVRHADDRVASTRACPQADEFIAPALLKQVAPTDSLLDQTAGWLQQLSPGVRPSALRVDLADVSALRFNYTGTNIDSASRDHRAGNVGFGLTYCLPLIIACLAAPKGALLLLENPEAHLHPRGQAALGQLMAQCAADGVQIVVETHSDHVLNGVRLAVKRGIIIPSAVALHYFTRDLESGRSSVESPTLLSGGRLIHGPLDFLISGVGLLTNCWTSERCGHQSSFWITSLAFRKIAIV